MAQEFLYAPPGAMRTKVTSRWSQVTTTAEQQRTDPKEWFG
ncbi:MAG: hypothetical protein Q7S20_07800 [Gemmatimonadaceae bacterium]|nr:hypothetical protein [Gemmatimonadaceae bacterium]